MDYRPAYIRELASHYWLWLFDRSYVLKTRLLFVYGYDLGYLRGGFTCFYNLFFCRWTRTSTVRGESTPHSRYFLCKGLTPMFYQFNRWFSLFVFTLSWTLLDERFVNVSLFVSPFVLTHPVGPDQALPPRIHRQVFDDFLQWKVWAVLFRQRVQDYVSYGDKSLFLLFWKADLTKTPLSRCYHFGTAILF